MADVPVQWRGKPVTELTREELIEAVEQLCRMVKQRDADAMAAMTIRSVMAGSRSVMRGQRYG